MCCNIDVLYCIYCSEDLKRRLPNPTCKVFEGHFKALSRSIVSHGSSLLHSKDLKDFFVDILENIVLPLQDLGLSYSDVSNGYHGDVHSDSYHDNV